MDIPLITLLIPNLTGNVSLKRQREDDQYSIKKPEDCQWIVRYGIRTDDQIDGRF